MREWLTQINTLSRDYFTYWSYQVARHPALDFVSMGLGIRARFRHSKRAWQSHLQHSRLFIRKVSSFASSHGNVAILGAGRLYDFPLDYFADGAWKLDLYDYDPSLKNYWKKLKSKAPQIGACLNDDLTGVLDEWERRLWREGEGLSEKHFCDLLLTLPAVLRPQYNLSGSYRCVVSLNILSQLGLYWRDRVERVLLKRRFICSAGESWPERIENALCANIAALEDAHLQMIENVQAELVIIISDRRYIYYQKNKSEYQLERALQREPNMAGYSLVENDSWYWHIAPQGKDNPEFGELHEVEARGYRLL